MPRVDLNCPACGQKNVYKLAELDAGDAAGSCHLCGRQVPLTAAIRALVVDFQQRRGDRLSRTAIGSLPVWLREQSFLACLFREPAVYQERDPERELRHLKARFRVISRRSDRIIMFRRVRLWVLGAAVAGAILGVALASVPGASLEAKLNDLAAAPSCRAAAAVGLAPANRGAPGYWPWLDADDDGIACEPWPSR